MTTHSVETGSPQRQAEPRCVGRWADGTRDLRLTETDQPAVLHLWRYRVHALRDPTVAAAVSHHGGVVSAIAWDPWHREHASQQWRADVAHWVRAMVARDWAERA